MRITGGSDACSREKPFVGHQSHIKFTSESDDQILGNSMPMFVTCRIPDSIEQSSSRGWRSAETTETASRSRAFPMVGKEANVEFQSEV
jgi:hypothetical protein